MKARIYLFICLFIYLFTICLVAGVRLSKRSPLQKRVCQDKASVKMHSPATENGIKTVCIFLYIFDVQWCQWKRRHRSAKLRRHDSAKENKPKVSCHFLHGYWLIVCTDVAAPYQSMSCSIPLVLDQWLVIRANWLHVLTTEQLQFGIWLPALLFIHFLTSTLLSVAYSPDGRLVTSGSVDHSVKIVH